MPGRPVGGDLSPAVAVDEVLKTSHGISGMASSSDSLGAVDQEDCSRALLDLPAQPVHFQAEPSGPQSPRQQHKQSISVSDGLDQTRTTQPAATPIGPESDSPDHARQILTVQPDGQSIPASPSFTSVEGQAYQSQPVPPASEPSASSEKAQPNSNGAQKNMALSTAVVKETSCA